MTEEEESTTRSSASTGGGEEESPTRSSEEESRRKACEAEVEKILSVIAHMCDEDVHLRVSHDTLGEAHVWISGLPEYLTPHIKEMMPRKGIGGVRTHLNFGEYPVDEKKGWKLIRPAPGEYADLDDYIFGKHPVDEREGAELDLLVDFVTDGEIRFGTSSGEERKGTHDLENRKLVMNIRRFTRIVKSDLVKFGDVGILMYEPVLNTIFCMVASHDADDALLEAAKESQVSIVISTDDKIEFWAWPVAEPALLMDRRYPDMEPNIHLPDEEPGPLPFRSALGSKPPGSPDKPAVPLWRIGLLGTAGAISGILLFGVPLLLLSALYALPAWCAWTWFAVPHGLPSVSFMVFYAAVCALRVATVRMPDRDKQNSKAGFGPLALIKKHIRDFNQDLKEMAFTAVFWVFVFWILSR